MPSSSPKLSKSGIGCAVVFLVLAALLAIWTHNVWNQIKASRVGYARYEKGIEWSRAMSLYLLTHHGQYPPAKSSTEIFQKLLDAHVVENPDALYFPMPGKVPAGKEATRLLPENVCWDIIVPDGPPDWKANLMMVSTGVRVTYSPGPSVILRPDMHWLETEGSPYRVFVYYTAENGDGGVRLFKTGTTVEQLSLTDRALSGKTYHQLTPDGELAP